MVRKRQSWQRPGPSSPESVFFWDPGLPPYTHSLIKEAGPGLETAGGELMGGPGQLALPGDEDSRNSITVVNN